MDPVNISQYDGKNKHVDSNIVEGEFMDASRTLIYAAKYKEGTRELDVFRKIGLIQSYGWQERKEVQQIFELGSNISYLIPGRTTGSISLSRVYLSGKDLLNTLYYGSEDEITPEQFMKSLGDTDDPIHLMFANFSNGPGDGDNKVYSRIFANCHITGRQESLGAGQRVLLENASLIYSHIVDASVRVS